MILDINEDRSKQVKDEEIYMYKKVEMTLMMEKQNRQIVMKSSLQKRYELLKRVIA